MKHCYVIAYDLAASDEGKRSDLEDELSESNLEPTQQSVWFAKSSKGINVKWFMTICEKNILGTKIVSF